MEYVTNQGDAEVLLNAPVGKVKDTLDTLLGLNSTLVVTEQGSVSGTKFTRKIVISAKGVPLIKAEVRFDSSVLPDGVLEELLKMKEGVGTILEKKSVIAKRKNLDTKYSEDKRSIIRTYEIARQSVGESNAKNDNDSKSSAEDDASETVWFFITEEIRLDFIKACKNC